ncbi:MAG: hypothetical protein RRA92_10900 [Gemmatimonadota bacterium]|nr:hypothetical protein [Gemmatimonadota bacterium]
MKPIPLALVFLLAGSPLVAQEPPGDVLAPPPTHLHGTLLGPDGGPIPVSHVHVLPETDLREAIASVAAGPDGTWSLEIEETGVFLLRFTGADHLEAMTRLLVPEAGEEIAVDARLGGHEIPDELEEVTLIGDFNDFSFGAGGVPMKRGDDGRFRATVETDADTLAYQVLGVAGSRSINGTMGDRLVYDGGGDYRSVVGVDDGRVEIVFDPSLLRRSDAKPATSFRDEESAPARFAALVDALMASRTAVQEDYAARVAAGATREEARAAYEEHDPAPDLAALEAYLERTDDPNLRAYGLTAYLSTALSVDSTTARRALTEVPPDSPAWAVGMQTLPRAFWSAGDMASWDGYAMQALKSNPARAVRPGLLSFLHSRARAAGEAEKADLLYA